jgi:hypothetical protein
MSNTIIIISDILYVLMGLILLGAAVFAGVRCTQKKLAPTAAWILAAGFALALLSDMGFLVTSTLLKTLGSLAHWIVTTTLSAVSLLGLLCVAAGIGLFSAKLLSKPSEASHG